MLDALPELRPCYERLFDDWDNFEGQPPGQYIVFAESYSRMVEILLTLPVGTVGRLELLKRAIDFGEQMLASRDDEVRSLGLDALVDTTSPCANGSPSIKVRSLGLDALVDTLNGHPAGPAIARDLGGPELKRWLTSYRTQTLGSTVASRDHRSLGRPRGDCAAPARRRTRGHSRHLPSRRLPSSAFFV